MKSRKDHIEHRAKEAFAESVFGLADSGVFIEEAQRLLLSHYALHAIEAEENPEEEPEALSEEAQQLLLSQEKGHIH